MQPEQNILNIPYKNLPVSPSMKRFMNIHGFDSLELMLENTLAQLLKMKGFNMHSFKELYDFLKKEGIEGKLRAS